MNYFLYKKKITRHHLQPKKFEIKTEEIMLKLEKHSSTFVNIHKEMDNTPKAPSEENRRHRKSNEFYNKKQ